MAIMSFLLDFYYRNVRSTSYKHSDTEPGCDALPNICVRTPVLLGTLVSLKSPQPPTANDNVLVTGPTNLRSFLNRMDPLDNILHFPLLILTMGTLCNIIKSLMSSTQMYHIIWRSTHDPSFGFQLHPPHFLILGLFWMTLKQTFGRHLCGL